MQFWAVSLDEVLVAVRRVEAAHADEPVGLVSAHDADSLVIRQFLVGFTCQGKRGEVVRRPLSPERLAGPRRSVEDDLALAFEHGLDAPRDAFKPRYDSSLSIRRGWWWLDGDRSNQRPLLSFDEVDRRFPQSV